MSTHIDFVDRVARVAWICFDGRGDELEANMRAYGIEYVPAFRQGCVGVTYRMGIEETVRARFFDAAVEAVDLLTMRRGITRAQEETFAVDLGLVQDCQMAAAEATA